MTQQAKIQTDRPIGGVPANGWNITLAWVLIFFVCDHNFCSRPETKPENRFLRGLIHRMSIQGYWFPRGIRLQKNPIYPIFTPKTQIQDGGRPPSWKTENGHISATPWPICTTFGTMTPFWLSEGHGQLKFPTVKNPRWLRMRAKMRSHAKNHTCCECDRIT